MRSVAQQSQEPALSSKLPAFQDSLLSLSKQFINKESEPERYNAN